ncbi:MAG TPA: hypothetical protein VKQ36_05305, partial [Ktedonobacterales bacterium]|nr:hypothetical protein [Ktedonobacterales bacterium]
ARSSAACDNAVGWRLKPRLDGVLADAAKSAYADSSMGGAASASRRSLLARDGRLCRSAAVPGGLAPAGAFGQWDPWG